MSTPSNAPSKVARRIAQQWTDDAVDQEHLANIIDSETNAPAMAEALTKLLRAYELNYILETMIYEGLFENAQLALDAYRK